MYLLALFVLGVLVKYSRVYYRMTMWRRSCSHIPSLPLEHFWKGHKETLLRLQRQNKYLDQHIEWMAQTGSSTILFWIIAHPAIFTADPVILREIAYDLDKYTKSQYLPNRNYFGEKLVGADSVLSANGMIWAQKRKAMMTMFSKKNMKNLWDRMDDVMGSTEITRIANTIGTGPKGRVIDLHDTVAVAFYAFLIELGVSDIMDNVEMAATAKTILAAIPKSVYGHDTIRPREMSLDTLVMVRNLRANIHKKVAQLIPNHKETAGVNVMEDLVHATKIQFDKFDGTSTEEMADRLVNDTIAMVLVFDNMVKQISMLYILLEHEPEIQEKMVKELRETEVNSFADLEKLEYTERCILECMRMRPSLLRGARDFKAHLKKGATEEAKFGPYVIPKELKMAIKVHTSEYVQQMDPKYWDKPTKYNPDRWEKGFSPKSFQYLPFWTGPRSCLGKHLGMMLMKIALYHINRNFDIQQAWDKHTAPVFLQPMATIRLIGDVPCRFKKREM